MSQAPSAKLRSSHSLSLVRSVSDLQEHEERSCAVEKRDHFCMVTNTTGSEPFVLTNNQTTSMKSWEAALHHREFPHHAQPDIETCMINFRQRTSIWLRSVTASVSDVEKCNTHATLQFFRCLIHIQNLHARRNIPV